MWDREYKRARPGPSVQVPERKKVEIEIPDAARAVGEIDAALAKPYVSEDKIVGKPLEEWSREQVLERIKWLKQNQPEKFLMFIVTGCGCFLEGDDR